MLATTMHGLVHYDKVVLRIHVDDQILELYWCIGTCDDKHEE